MDDVVCRVVLEEIIASLDQRLGVGRIVVGIQGQHDVGGRHGAVIDARTGIDELHRELGLLLGGRHPGGAGIDVDARRRRCPAE